MMTDDRVPYHVSKARADDNEALKDGLAIAAGKTHASPKEFARLRALAHLMAQLLDALVWLEDTVCSMPTLQYDSSGVHHAIMNAREVIHAADGLTRTDEEQANLARERDAVEIANEFMDIPMSQGPHGVFSTETHEDLPRSPTPPAHDAHRGDTP